MEEDKRETRVGNRHRLSVKAIKLTSVLYQKKHGVSSHLCQLASKLDYGQFFRQVRLTCHFVIFPIRFTTENKVTSAVTVLS